MASWRQFRGRPGVNRLFLLQRLAECRMPEFLRDARRWETQNTVPTECTLLWESKDFNYHGFGRGSSHRLRRPE